MQLAILGHLNGPLAAEVQDVGSSFCHQRGSSDVVRIEAGDACFLLCWMVDVA